MEELEKVERLVNITGVSYEDARNALNGCDGNLVDAMVYLAEVGKVKAKTSTEIDPRFAPISDAEIAAAAVRNEKNVAVREKKRTIGEFLAKIIRFLLSNKIAISKNGRSLISIPLLAVIIICCISLGTAVVAVIISMLFGFEYSYKKGSAFAVI